MIAIYFFAKSANNSQMNDLEFRNKIWLADKLKAAGRGARLKLAEDVGLTPTQISRMANVDREADPKNTQNIPLPVLRKLAEYYKDTPPGLSGVSINLPAVSLNFEAPPLAVEKVNIPPRPSRRFHIQEWRIHSEWGVHDLAKAIGVDDATYEFLETYPHKFTIEQIEAIAKKLKVQFDTLRFEPPPKDKPRPATKTAPAKKAAKR